MKNKATNALTLTVEEAGKRMGLSRGAAYAAARRGELPVIHIGRRILVPIAALENWLAEPRPQISELPPGAHAA